MKQFYLNPSLLQSHFLNEWSSDYLVTFARYNDKSGINEIWDIFQKGVQNDDE